MKEICISLIIILVVLIILYMKLSNKLSLKEGFVSCKINKDCPYGFNCKSGQCIDTRPKGN